MRDSLEKICSNFITNRDIVKKTFKMDNGYIYPVCANIFCSRGMIADEYRLENCKKLIKKRTGVFSDFRGNIIAPISCMLAVDGNPENKLDKAFANYNKLRENFKGSEYLSLISFLLTDMADNENIEEKAVRGKAIYSRMKKEHPFLTSQEDSVFAVLMAFLDRADDEMMEDMESCYKILNGKFSSKDSVQLLSQTLVFSEQTPREKTDRVISIYDSIIKGGRKYGKHSELATLGAVAMLDVEIPQLVSDILEVDKFLASQKGYGGFGLDNKTRIMHAAMLVSDDYYSQGNVEAASITGTISMIAAQQAAMCAILASTTVATTVSTN